METSKGKDNEKGSRIVRDKLCAVPRPSCMLGAAMRECPTQAQRRSRPQPGSYCVAFKRGMLPLNFPGPYSPPYPGPHRLPWPLNKRKGWHSSHLISAHTHIGTRDLQRSPRQVAIHSLNVGSSNHHSLLPSTRDSHTCV